MTAAGGLTRRWRFHVAVVCLAGVSIAAQTPEDVEELARRQYASGIEFLRAGKHVEALKDFQIVVDSYAGSSVADDALLAIAQYELEVALDPASAHATADSVLKKFPASDSVAMAYVIAGRALVERGLTQTNVDAALASFERVPRLFPGSPAVAPAVYAAGETLRRLDRCDEALDRFDRVVLEVPRSDWAARARLSRATCLARLGRAVDAMSALQRVSATYAGGEWAAEARTLGTILYRLYVRPPTQPAYTLAQKTYRGPSGRLRSVTGLAAASDGSLFVASRAGIAVMDPQGATLRSPVAGDMRGLALDRRGRLVAAQRALVAQEHASGPATLVTLTAPRAEGGAARVIDDIASIAVLSSGDRLVADRDSRAVYRFDENGKYMGAFASVRAARIAVDPLDRVALLDRDAKTVAVLDRNGATVTRLPARATGYELQSPSDIAFDAFGHLYVLDRASVYVFAPGATTPLVTFSDQGSAAAGLRNGTALALDAAARLYIHDEAAERVLVYQ
jgi:TolA-binding protein